MAAAFPQNDCSQEVEKQETATFYNLPSEVVKFQVKHDLHHFRFVLRESLSRVCTQRVEIEPYLWKGRKSKNLWTYCRTMLVCPSALFFVYPVPAVGLQKTYHPRYKAVLGMCGVVWL
jgi:hypothetical protein